MSHANAESVTGVVSWWHHWRETDNDVAELEHYNRGEAARVAREMSLTVAELHSLVSRGADAADLLYRRMADLGLRRSEVTRSEPAVMRDLQKNCSLCESKAQCRYDFARNADPQAWHAYCPNDSTIRALLGEPVETAGPAHVIPHEAVATSRRQMPAWPWALLVVGAVLVILGNLYPMARLQLPPDTASTPVAANTSAPRAGAVDCLDDRCLSAAQQASLQTLEDVRNQGVIGSSAQQLQALPLASADVQYIHRAEASACLRAGGTTYYGFMYQSGCGLSGAEAARRNGYNTCRPMTGGGVCLSE